MSYTAIRARTLIVDAYSAPIDDGAILIDSAGVITHVATWTELRDTASDVIAVADVLMPGMVDAHSHLRGIPLEAHGIPARQFESWICSLAAMTELDPRDEALVAATGLLETGVTAVQGFVDAGADERDALHRSVGTLVGLTTAGIRALVVLGFADRALTAPEPATGDWQLVPTGGPMLKPEAVPAVAQRWLGLETAPTISLGIGPVGAHWSSDALLEALAAAAGDARVHSHVHESRLHRAWLAGSPSPFDRLDQSGLLNDRFSAAHGVHLESFELDRLALSGASLVHCPVSNDALQVGTASVRDWLDRSIAVGLGIDSQNLAAPDMFDVMRAARASGASDSQIFAMATTGGAQALGLPHGGRIVVGAPADVVELDIAGNTVEHVVEAASAAAVRRVWVGGSLVVSDGHSLADSTAAIARLQQQLNDDDAARSQRLSEQAATVALVERLAKATT